MSTTRLILGAEWRNLRHWLLDTRQGRSASFGTAVAVVLLGPFLLGGGSLAGFAFARLGIDPAGIFAGGFSAVALMMFAFGLPGIISAFFADRPLLLYAAAPISSLQLYVARLVQATLPAGLVGVVLLAVVFGYGVAAHLSPAFGLLAIVLVVALALTVVSLSVCLMCLVLRVVPATRARDVAGVVLALIGSSFYLVQFVLRGPLQVAKQDPHQLLRQVTALGDRLAWLPTSWPAEALSAWAVNSPLRAVGWTALSLALGALTVAAGWFLYQQTLVLGLGVFGEAGAGSSRRRRSRPQPAAARRPGTANPVTAIAAKDLMALRRDFRRLAGTLPALAMAVVWTFVNANHVPAGFWGVALPVSFVPGVVSLALALPAVAGEGRGMQLLVLAGLPMRTFLLAKLLSVLPVILPLTLATATVLLVVNHLGPAESVQVILLAAWFGCGMPAITVAAGALGPNFAAPDPRRGVNPGWVMGGIAMVAVFGVLSFGGLLALQLAAGGELPLLLVPFGVLLLAGSAAIVGGMLVTALRYLERWRPGE